VAILDDDVRTLRETERFFAHAGVEVYADQDPLRWLAAITDLESKPDLILLAHQLKGHDCSLQLDVVNRRWPDTKLNVVVLIGAQDAAVDEVGKLAPFVVKPMSQAKLEGLLDVLSGRLGLPSSGCF
jgi:DNA-binding response OmpR family regulator